MIKNIKASQILDSRKNPTVNVVLELDNGKTFEASVPSGASTGIHEAVELKDKLKAINNVNEIIAPALISKDPKDQKSIDEIMIKLDGTENKANLGANAILGVSIATARAGADSLGIPLYKHLNQISGLRVGFPRPCFNIINGGAHAKGALDIQEFMIVPSEGDFNSNLKAGKDIYAKLKDILGDSPLGDEGGYCPDFLTSTSQALDFITQAMTGYPKTQIGLDCAASQFFKNNKYILEGKEKSTKEMIEFYNELISKYPIIFIEDAFSEEDFDSFREIYNEVKGRIDIIGDDLTTTNMERMEKAKGACSGIILKPNQIGTVTEAIDAGKLARSFGWKVIVSHRSGETMDDFIADLAVGIGADFIKTGAPGPKERMAKYNRLSEIQNNFNN